MELPRGPKPARASTLRPFKKPRTRILENEPRRRGQQLLIYSALVHRVVSRAVRLIQSGQGSRNVSASLLMFGLMAGSELAPVPESRQGAASGSEPGDNNHFGARTIMRSIWRRMSFNFARVSFVRAQLTHP